MVTYGAQTQRPFYVFDPRKPWKEQSAQAIRREIAPGLIFFPGPWPTDGQQLAGSDNSNLVGGAIVLYSFSTRRFTRFDDSNGGDAIWLNDNRHLLFTDLRGRLRLLDIATKTSREVFSILPDSIESPALSRDNRTLYFTRGTKQTDIWLMRSK